MGCCIVLSITTRSFLKQLTNEFLIIVYLAVKAMHIKNE